MSQLVETIRIIEKYQNEKKVLGHNAKVVILLLLVFSRFFFFGGGVCLYVFDIRTWVNLAILITSLHNLTLYNMSFIFAYIRKKNFIFFLVFLFYCVCVVRFWSPVLSFISFFFFTSRESVLRLFFCILRGWYYLVLDFVVGLAGWW